MHDMRELQLPKSDGWRGSLRRLRAELHAKIHGLGNPPTSHFRRAVRPEELFFVFSAPGATELAQRFRRRNPANVDRSVG
jgi:hypothetical protein